MRFGHIQCFFRTTWGLGFRDITPEMKKKMEIRAMQAIRGKDPGTCRDY